MPKIIVVLCIILAAVCYNLDRLNKKQSEVLCTFGCVYYFTLVMRSTITEVINEIRYLLVLAVSGRNANKIINMTNLRFIGI